MSTIIFSAPRSPPQTLRDVVDSYFDLTNASFTETALKVLSYVTVIIPLIVLAIHAKKHLSAPASTLVEVRSRGDGMLMQDPESLLTSRLQELQGDEPAKLGNEIAHAIEMSRSLQRVVSSVQAITYGHIFVGAENPIASHVIEVRFHRPGSFRTIVTIPEESLPDLVQPKRLVQILLGCPDEESPKILKKATQIIDSLKIYIAKENLRLYEYGLVRLVPLVPVN